MAEVYNVYTYVDTPEEEGTEILQEGRMFGVQFRVNKIKICKTHTAVTYHKDAVKPKPKAPAENLKK